MSSNIVCRITARSIGVPGLGWGLILSNADRKVSFGTWLSSESSRLIFGRGFSADTGPADQVFDVPGVNHGDAANTFVILVRGRYVEMYVNGMAACPPMTIDADIWPARLYLRASVENRGRVEFQDVAVWSADKLPVVRPEFGADRRRSGRNQSQPRTDAFSAFPSMARSLPTFRLWTLLVVVVPACAVLAWRAQSSRDWIRQRERFLSCGFSGGASEATKVVGYTGHTLHGEKKTVYGSSVNAGEA